MRLKWFVALAIAIGLTSPTLADYYVAQGDSKKCQVTEKKPDGKTLMMVGKTGYQTKSEADQAMKSAKECK